MVTQRSIEKMLYKRSIFSYLLLPFSLLYATILVFRRFFFTFIFKGYKSKCFIISIGNIVSGGSGKTPTTIFLSKQLQKKNIQTAVVLRGYKGKFEQTNKLISTKETVLPEAFQAGDEAQLLAENLPNTPIVVGKNRKKSIQLIEQKFPDINLIIMDDSFQNLKVQKDFSILVYNAIGKIGNGFVLPAGILREPLSSQIFADYSIINGTKCSFLETKIRTKFSYANYRVSQFLFDGTPITSATISNERIALLSGIGIPKSFENTIHNAKLTFVHHFKMPDHYAYNNIKVLAEIKSFITQNKIKYVLTTEKDFTKLSKLDHQLPLIVVQVKFSIQDKDNLLQNISEKLARY